MFNQKILKFSKQLGRVLFFKGKRLVCPLNAVIICIVILQSTLAQNPTSIKLKPQVKTCAAPVKAQVGFCAPDIYGSVVDFDGKKILANELKDKIIFLHFWATWCPPCVKEMPELEQLYIKLDPKKVAFVSVSVDDKGKAFLDRFFFRFFKGVLPPYKVYMNNTNLSLSKAYGAFKMPETFIIDRQGIVRDKIEGATSWNDSMRSNYLHLLYDLNKQ